MFEFSSKTLVNKEFKLKDIFKIINATKDIKKDSSAIKKVTLKNVLSEDTLGMKSSEECKEIYIIEIEVCEKRVPLDFIKAFDKIIELHTFFIIRFNEEVTELVIHRNIDNNVIKRNNIYESTRQYGSLKELPYCMSIKEVYSNLVFNLIDLNPTQQEELSCFLERFNKIQKIKKEIITLEKKVFKEKQPRKKFDMGRELRVKREELRGLEG